MRLRAGVSPVAVRSGADEAQALGALTWRDYETVLVVSDLHLGEGRDPDTGLYRLTENFTADDAFGRLIDHEAALASGGLMVLLGDTFDFLRITRVPESQAEVAAWRTWLERLGEAAKAAQLPDRIPRGEREYGLRTQDWKTIWKLQVILEGHGRFLEALVAWLSAGGCIILSTGNHDVELYWPLVRRALRDALLDAGTAQETVERAVVFADGGFTVGDLYLEHGHQYEGMTRVEGPAVLPGRSEEINLPLGSFVNRYFINKIERLDPFLDNRKPVQRALLALLRRRPLAVGVIYAHGLKFLGKAATRLRSRPGLAAIGLVLLFYAPVVAILIAIALFRWPKVGERVLTWLPFLQITWVRKVGLVAGLLPYAFAFALEVGRSLGLFRGRDHLEDGAVERIRQRFPTPPNARRPPVYAVMGHTHRQTVKRLGQVREHARYVNTGTWIPLWPEDRPDLAGRTIYSVTRFTCADGAWSHAALEWNDDAGELRPAPIVVAPEE